MEYCGLTRRPKVLYQPALRRDSLFGNANCFADALPQHQPDQLRFFGVGNWLAALRADTAFVAREVVAAFAADSSLQIAPPSELQKPTQDGGDLHVAALQVPNPSPEFLRDLDAQPAFKPE